MKTKLKMLVLFVSLMFASCATTYFDHFTFTETVKTKAMVENLFQISATQQYSDNLASVNELQVQLRKMLQYEQSKENNLIMQKMWEVHNKEGSALQGFFKVWKEQGTMSQAFIDEFTPEVVKSFELMVDFENNKSKENESLLMTALNTLTQ